MAYTRTFGEVYGHPEGSWYHNRDDLRAAGLHAERQAGISGTQREGTDAIVLSGGYEDDKDYGDIIVYTGQGGQKEGKQVDHQSFSYRGNAGLVKSQYASLPVRIIRGAVPKSEHAPAKGYRYGGLYRVVSHWYKVRDDGFQVCQFLLVKIGSFFDTEDVIKMFPERNNDIEVETFSSGPPAQRVPTAVNKIQRRATVRNNIKTWHENQCQICNTIIELPIGPTSETAHIRPLGTPHNGPDEEPNALCLCPNDHLRFDHGALYIRDNFEVVDSMWKTTIGSLRVHQQHRINIDYIRYHRNHWFSSGGVP
ncbi:YDG/SRA domain-containing protein [Streptomonospora halophila]|uniref:YDG/SRA domain-containing protein n=1 Tax=Streptomonospora halophila TaxID=427369 RepID=UPI0031EE561A